MGRRRPRWTYLLRLAWREGRTTERLFVAYIASVTILVLSVVAIITIVSGVSSHEAIWFWFVSLGGIVCFPGFPGTDLSLSVQSRLHASDTFPGLDASIGSRVLPRAATLPFYPWGDRTGKE